MKLTRFLIPFLLLLAACGDDDGAGADTSADVPVDTVQPPSDAPCAATTLLADGAFSDRSTFDYDAAGRLTSTTLYFSRTGSPAGYSEFAYTSDGSLLREDFNGSPDDSAFTGRVDYIYDGEGQLTQIDATNLPDTLTSRTTFTYDDQGRVSETTRELLDPQSSVTQVVDTYTWRDATTAEVARVVSFREGADATSTQLRVYMPFTNYRPLRLRDADLPGTILVEQGVDSNADGALQDGEHTFRRTIENGRILESTEFNQQFEPTATRTFEYSCE